MRTEIKYKGRKPDEALSGRILHHALLKLSDCGLEALKLDDLASDLGTSKQALYRRFPSKAALAIASIDHALQKLAPPPPERSNPARDLSLLLNAYWRDAFSAPLGHALLRTRQFAPFDQRAFQLEQDLEFAIRQILIATAFERGMDTRIRLFVALLWQMTTAREDNDEKAQTQINEAILVILGLQN